MNKKIEMIVFRSRVKDAYLKSYKDRGTLAFEADYCCLEHCLKLPRKKYEENKKTYKALAAAFDCEIVAVEAEYKLTYPNGNELQEIKTEEQPGLALKKLLDFLVD